MLSVTMFSVFKFVLRQQGPKRRHTSEIIGFSSINLKIISPMMRVLLKMMALFLLVANNILDVDGGSKSRVNLINIDASSSSSETEHQGNLPVVLGRRRSVD